MARTRRVGRDRCSTMACLAFVLRSPCLVLPRPALSPQPKLQKPPPGHALCPLHPEHRIKLRLSASSSSRLSTQSAPRHLRIIRYPVACRCSAYLSLPYRSLATRGPWAFLLGRIATGVPFASPRLVRFAQGIFVVTSPNRLGRRI